MVRLHLHQLGGPAVQAAGAGAPNKYHDEYIPVARARLEQMGKLHAFDVTWASQAHYLDRELTQYAAIVPMNSSGEDFNEKQREAFENSATFGLPERWIWSDEWYELSNPYNVKINTVLAVDQASYDPTRIWKGQVAKGMGRDHPVAWYHQVGKARVFVTTLGHDGRAYRDPQYLSRLLGGMYWAATGRGIR